MPPRRPPFPARGLAGCLGVLCLAAAVLAAAPARAKTKREEAMETFERGAGVYKEGRFIEAATIFHTAFSLDPRPEYLFNAARSEHRAGDLIGARTNYERCLALPKVSPEIAERARAFLAEVEAALADAERKRQEEVERLAAQKKKEREASDKQAPSRTAAAGRWKVPAGWGAATGGLLVSGVGAWLLVGALGEQGDIDALLGRTNAAGRVTGLDYQTYADRQQRANTRRSLGVGSLSLGGVALAAGVWLLLSAPSEETTLVAAPGGLGLAWRIGL